MPEKNKNFVYFLIHSFFYDYSMSLYFTFGVLLLYNKLSSLMFVLLFYAGGRLFVFLLQTIFIKYFVKILNKIKLKRAMFLGTLFAAIINLIIFLLHSQSLPLFMLLGILLSFSSIIYQIPNNMIGYEIVGKASRPGISSAYITIITLSSSILAAITGLAFNSFGSIIPLYLFSSVAFIIGLIPILYLKIPDEKIEAEFPKYTKIFSLSDFLANVNVDNTLRVIGFPLFLITFFSTVSLPAWITGVVSLFTILFVYMIGKMKDGNNNALVFIASILNICSWISLGFAHDKYMFVIIGIILGTTEELLTTIRSARISRIATNRKNYFYASLAGQFAHYVGSVIGIIILCSSVLFFGTVTRWVLMLGLFFSLTMIYYAFGKIENRNEI